MFKVDDSLGSRSYFIRQNSQLFSDVLIPGKNKISFAK